jgi:solute carrier family 50 protein (sugar transporter)
MAFSTLVQAGALVDLCGKTAPVVCSGVFLAPIPTVANIVSQKSVGSLPLLPYSSMVVNAFIWTTYGILNAESKIWSPNAFGLLMGMYYCAQYQKYLPKHAKNLPGTLSQHARYGSLLMMFTLLLATGLNKSLASLLIGKLGVIVCIVLFASPLAALKEVIATRNAKSIPLP